VPIILSSRPQEEISSSELRISANAEVLIDIITDRVYLEGTISQPFQFSFNKA